MDYRKHRPAGEPFDRRNAFRLARELAALGLPVGMWLYRGDAAASLARAGVRPDDLFVHLRQAQKRVTATRETDRMAVAMREADLCVPLFARQDRPPMYARAAALAWRLAVARPPGAWFPFPSARLAVWLDIHRNTADGLVCELEDDGLIAVRRNKAGQTVWDSRVGRAREVTFVGPRPEGD